MAKLTEGHVEQIKMMRKDKKTQSEIKEFFKATYGINLTNNNVTYPGVAKGLKRNYVKRAAKVNKPGIKDLRPGGIKPVEVAAAPDEFNSLIQKAFGIHKQGFIKRVEQAVAAA